MSVNASNAKKRRLDHDKQNHAVNSTNSSPIVYINVGGANRNIRRSLLIKLRQVSHDNPLCILLLQGAHHWSDVPTTTDQDGTNTVRIYVDRNPDAFDDLLEYVEYGKEFLETIVKNNDDEAHYRLRKLGSECDYFTVDSFAADVDEVTRRMDDDVDFGEPISFRNDSWFSMAGQRCRGGFNGGWRWNNISGNSQSIASKNTSRSPNHYQQQLHQSIMKIFSTSLTLIASAFIGANKAKATYTRVGGLNGGVCESSLGDAYSYLQSPYVGTNVADDDASKCNPYPDDGTALFICETYCSNYLTKHVGLEVFQETTGDEGAAKCWGCTCLFDDPNGDIVKNNTIQQLYDPEPIGVIYGGTGPIVSTEIINTYVATCYKYTAPTPAPTDQPISAPTRKPIATTSAPTHKPTDAGSKSSKGVKASKKPSAKSSKNAKRG